MKSRSPRDLFHLVKQLLPEDQELISLSIETPVRDAFKIMQERGFSQLPVVEGTEVFGVFSYRSFAQKLAKVPEKIKDPLSLSVENFLENLCFVQVTHELDALLNEFDVNDAVLVGVQGQLLGIVTTIDVLRYFHAHASPYILIQEIELALRELIRIAVGIDELLECINKSLRKHYEVTNKEPPNALEKMTFHDCVTLLRYQGTWNKFASAFGKNQDIAAAKLVPVAKLRNEVFHFRRELTPEDYETLRDCRDWLLTRIRLVEAITQGKRGGQNQGAA